MLLLNACVHTLQREHCLEALGLACTCLLSRLQETRLEQIATRKESSLACLTAHHCLTSFFTLIRAFLHGKPEQTLLAGSVAC